MKATITVAAATFLSCYGALAVQQTETPEEADTAEGIPATSHQEEATREVGSGQFTQLDQDGDGVISREEAQAEAMLSDSWSRFDQDGDGTLNQEEFSQFEQESAAHDEHARAGGQSDVERQAAEGLPTTPHQEQAVEGDLVGQLDKDGDGQISQEEAQAEARLADNWDQYDENGDGRLDSRELDQFQQELRESEEAE